MSKTYFDCDLANNIFDDISAERVRQDRLRDMGKFPWTLKDVENYHPMAGTSPMGEEFGEVCRAVCENDPTHLREELVQLAACCVAWIEGLDRMTGEYGARRAALTPVPPRPGVLDAEFED